MVDVRLFHVSEENKIEIFIPRISPSYFENINSKVVFACAEEFLHNYLLPRDCPRVSFYAGENTRLNDKKKFISEKKFVLNIQENWLSRIENSSIYIYEFQNRNFSLLDKNAGYYISPKVEKFIDKFSVENIMEELSKRKNLEIRFVKDLKRLADEIGETSLNFSCIRLSNL